MHFAVADNSGKVHIVLVVYKTVGNRTVLLRKQFNVSAPSSGRPYTITVHVKSVGAHLWCITANDAVGNASTACSSLVVT